MKYYSIYTEGKNSGNPKIHPDSRKKKAKEESYESVLEITGKVGIVEVVVKSQAGFEELGVGFGCAAPAKPGYAVAAWNPVSFVKIEKQGGAQRELGVDDNPHAALAKIDGRGSFDEITYCGANAVAGAQKNMALAGDPRVTAPAVGIADFFPRFLSGRVIPEILG